jgi:energy-coupling factor transporter ATP-binding protein EcfA2
MRIESVEIKNYRVFKAEKISFDNYCCLVGPNGAGKSTVLCALNVFFREPYCPAIDVTKMTEEDFYNKDTSDPVEISVTFTDLTDEANQDLKDYVRQGKLVVTARAEFDPNTLQAEVKQFGQRLGFTDFARFFQADKNKVTVPDLKAIYEELRKTYPDLPGSGTKQKMIESLQEYETAHGEKCQLIPSEDQFYGVSRGVNRLEKHIQWVFVPAVKDASTEELEAKNTALGKLLMRTVRSKVSFDDSLSTLLTETRGRYQSVLSEQQAALSELSESLTKRLGEWAHPEARLTVE